MVFTPAFTNAQPGWQDLTERYFYTIVDEKGNEISFKKNKAYGIMINDMLYKSPNIPQQELKFAAENSFDENKGYEIQIRINDFSLITFPNEYYDKELEIKIIHKKDTMLISQPSGIGSGNMEWTEINGVKKIRPADFVLPFIPGHYFFPDWAKTMLDNVPEISGNVKIKNVHSRNFIISAIPNPTIFQQTKKYQTEWFNAEVLENFKKGYFSLEHKIEPTQIENESPFVTNPDIKLIFPGQSKDECSGLIEYNYKTSGCEAKITRCASINAAKNTIVIWCPTEKTPYFSTYEIYNDTFNKILYNRSIIRDTTCDESQLKNMVDCPYTTNFYRSSDGGKIWQKDTTMTTLFNKYEIRTFGFLDKEYALARRRDYVPHKITSNIFYLFKNLQIVDSLEVPNEINYTHGFAVKRDTVFIGSWAEDPNDYYSVYFQPYLTRTAGKWKFHIEKRTAEDGNRYAVFSLQSRLDSIKEY